ncbi:hypothetical protein [Mesorhizobium sp. B2-6-4]|uniref:hypothetical protein n=1 Tax=Mesorhizobium sp. B2-6-4 TaxID=2589913 RepID=UPI0011280E39|nr:hypothetical protein [Mesorhizobium sp. B2-6-4]TPJ52703.1 hypothetical protein FJ426_15730 [Mesorhizobium sp. B2-6-4]
MPELRDDTHRSAMSSLGLIAIEIKLNDTAKIDESELYYGISVTRPEPGPEGKLYFVCKLECGKQIPDGERPAVSVEARYGCILDESVGDEALQIAMTITRYSIWAKFSDMFMLITSQMGIEFPPLPTEPSGIEVAKLVIEDYEPNGQPSN